jgi:hypothetical protein
LSKNPPNPRHSSRLHDRARGHDRLPASGDDARIHTWIATSGVANARSLLRIVVVHCQFTVSPHTSALTALAASASETPKQKRPSRGSPRKATRTRRLRPI